ncbi:MAG: peptide-methionine (R)-S-oxide reductase MsrB [bacterium]|nr:peptide-methionine (R)-S-oxide reductase MsrB [bacterium]
MNAGKGNLNAKLSPESYHITQEKGTEEPFSGKYLDNKEKGVYKCVVCGAELFSSDTKFDSGTGWPSFTEPSNLENVRLEPDGSHGMKRTEVSCKSCGAHLGHIFDDGPVKMSDGRPARGKRYCINSCSLDFEGD